MENKRAWGRRGYIYTVSIIILMVPLTLLLLFYTSTEKSKVEDTSARIRCDELYYFVQDVEYDMGRAMLIFGRRAATYATDCVVNLSSTCANPGTPLGNYTYTNCTPYVFNGNASEAAIAELILCGTMYGEEAEYMENYTLPSWLERIDDDSEEMDYEVNITVLDFEVLPYDAWNFSTMVTANLQFSDNSGYCYYIGEDVTLDSMTSIIGLEDPSYRLNTGHNVSKIIYNCDINMVVNNLAGCSTEDRGDGSGTGNVVFYSNLEGNLEDYCSTCGDKDTTIIVFDTAFGNCNSFDPDCFDANSSCHFAGAIDYAKNDPNSFTRKCGITIPWIAATGDIDNETDGGGHKRDPNCADGDIYAGACIGIRNVPECSVHQVVLGYNIDNVNTTCYVVSNSAQYGSECDTSYPDGPSFFDRLDGRLELDPNGTYVQQAEENFGNSDIGIETVINLDDLESHGLEPDMDASWVDYLYWQGEAGWDVDAVCGESTFKLDCQHAYFYTVDTSHDSGAGMPPVSEITSPANGTLFTLCPAVSINGTADDCDNEVSSVDVSVNGVWHGATYGAGKWNYTLSTSTTNKYVVSSRARDDSGVVERPSSSTTIFIINCTSGDNIRPTAPVLLYPDNGRTKVPRNPTFYWNDASDASGIYRYQIQVDDDPADWSDMGIDEYAWDTEYTHGSLLQNNHWFGWRVRAQDNAGNWGPWSIVWTFKT